MVNELCPTRINVRHSYNPGQRAVTPRSRIRNVHIIFRVWILNQCVGLQFIFCQGVQQTYIAMLFRCQLLTFMSVHVLKRNVWTWNVCPRCGENIFLTSEMWRKYFLHIWDTFKTLHFSLVLQVGKIKGVYTGYTCISNCTKTLPLIKKTLRNSIDVGPIICIGETSSCQSRGKRAMPN